MPNHRIRMTAGGKHESIGAVYDVLASNSRWLRRWAQLELWWSGRRLGCPIVLAKVPSAKSIAGRRSFIPSMKLQRLELGDVFFCHFLSMAVCVKFGRIFWRRRVVASLPVVPGSRHYIKNCERESAVSYIYRYTRVGLVGRRSFDDEDNNWANGARRCDGLFPFLADLRELWGELQQLQQFDIFLFHQQIPVVSTQYLGCAAGRFRSFAIHVEYGASPPTRVNAAKVWWGFASLLRGMAVTFVTAASPVCILPVWWLWPWAPGLDLIAEPMQIEMDKLGGRTLHACSASFGDRHTIQSMPLSACSVSSRHPPNSVHLLH